MQSPRKPAEAASAPERRTRERTLSLHVSPLRDSSGGGSSRSVASLDELTRTWHVEAASWELCPAAFRALLHSVAAEAQSAPGSAAPDAQTADYVASDTRVLLLAPPAAVHGAGSAAAEAPRVWGGGPFALFHSSEDPLTLPTLEMLAGFTEAAVVRDRAMLSSGARRPPRIPERFAEQRLSSAGDDGSDLSTTDGVRAWAGSGGLGDLEPAAAASLLAALMVCPGRNHPYLGDTVYTWLLRAAAYSPYPQLVSQLGLPQWARQAPRREWTQLPGDGGANFWGPAGTRVWVGVVDTIVDARDVAALQAAAAHLLPDLAGESQQMLFHGTAHGFVGDVVRGIDVTRGADAGNDFGPGFCATPSAATALWFAHTRNPAILVYRRCQHVPELRLEHAAPGDGGHPAAMAAAAAAPAAWTQWQSVTHAFHTRYWGHVPQATKAAVEAAHVLIGPISANPPVDNVAAHVGPPLPAGGGVTQVVLKSPAAAEAYAGALLGVLLLFVGHGDSMLQRDVDNYPAGGGAAAAAGDAPAAATE
jgi:hypothetical protein